MNRSVLPTIAAAFLLASSALAEVPNTYQVTGPIVELSDTKIVVMKGKENWELARTADTKVTGDLKVGAKVTIKYSMTAKDVEVRDEAAKK